MPTPAAATALIPKSMSYILVLQPVEGEPRELDLAEIQLPCVIGRDSDLSQIVLEDGQCSRAHCKLSQADDGLAIEDLDSRNGTWLNGNRIHRGVLRAGDLLR